MLLVIIGVAIVGFAIVTYFALQSKCQLNLENKHVMITGGSKGIGRAMAEEAIKAGANVTIIARNIDDLDTVKLYLLKKTINPKQKVLTASLDVCQDIFPIEQAVSDAESELGPVYLLVNCAGTSISGRFDETPLSEFKRMMDINYTGSVLTTRAVLPSMKAQKESYIMFVSSVSGLFGLYGYSAYSASKFAVVGLAEVLAMELKPFNISVTVCFPPDTDTPGFEEEQKTKPIETRLISESGGIVQANTVAIAALRDTLSKKFSSTVGIESLMVRTACCGMMPISSIWELIFQTITMPLCRLIGSVFLTQCSKIVAKCARKKSEDDLLASKSE